MTCLHRLALATAVLIAGAVAAETIDAGPFSVDVTPRLVLRYKDSVLVDGERCVSFRGLKPGEPALVDPAKGRVIRKGNTLVLQTEKGRNTLRREIMVTPEAVHITFEMRVFGPTGGSHLQYDLLTPGECLDGVGYDVWTGAPRSAPAKASGTFSLKDTKPFEYLVRSARYFILKRPGAECSIDFNPGGPWVGESNYGHNAHSTPYHDGKQFHLLMLCAGGRYGGVFRGKVIVRPGAQPYEALHSSDPVAYTKSFPVALAVNFSENAPAGDYTPLPAAAPAGTPCRWRDPAQIRIVERPTGGLLYRDFATAAESGTDGLLQIEQHPGLYLLTLNVHDAAEDTGPFSVAGPQGPLLGNVTIKRGEYWVTTVPLRVHQGPTALRFTGNWKIGALTLQRMLFDAEDFVLERPFWNLEIAGPDG